MCWGLPLPPPQYNVNVQAWNYTVDLVLAFVPLQKFPIDFKIFQWKCSHQNENGLAPSKACMYQYIFCEKSNVHPFLTMDSNKLLYVYYQSECGCSDGLLTRHFERLHCSFPDVFPLLLLLLFLFLRLFLFLLHICCFSAQFIYFCQE